MCFQDRPYNESGENMLHKFSVKNFKGFRDWLTLDLSKVKNYEFNPECIQNDTINKAIIYGYNNVGKSNLGLAVMDIVQHLTDKNKKPELYENYANGDSGEDIAEFAYWFKFADSVLKYKYGKRDFENIVYEDLEINGTKIVSYDRRQNQGLEINLSGTETLNKDINQIKISVLKYIKSNAVLTETKNSIVFDRLLTFVDGMLLFWQLMDRGYIGYQTGSSNMFKDIIEHGHFDDFKKFLESAKIGSNLAYTKNDDNKYTVYFEFENRPINFWDIASTGTKSLIVFYFWLQRMKFESNPPAFVFIDEFDAFYHQSLSRLIVQELKKNSCQIILTTHNTSIMDNELFRPDCYFLMYKDRIDALPYLTDKELREAHNIEKMYRAGVFND
jgi:AAA15 family ATPase/GTPase